MAKLVKHISKDYFENIEAVNKVHRSLGMPQSWGIRNSLKKYEHVLDVDELERITNLVNDTYVWMFRFHSKRKSQVLTYPCSQSMKAFISYHRQLSLLELTKEDATIELILRCGDLFNDKTILTNKK